MRTRGRVGTVTSSLADEHGNGLHVDVALVGPIRVLLGDTAWFPTDVEIRDGAEVELDELGRARPHHRLARIDGIGESVRRAVCVCGAWAWADDGDHAREWIAMHREEPHTSPAQLARQALDRTVRRG